MILFGIQPSRTCTGSLTQCTCTMKHTHGEVRASKVLCGPLVNCVPTHW